MVIKIYCRLLLILIDNPLRIDEFQSLILERIVFNNDGSVTLRPFEGFIPKNQSIKFTPENISIRSNVLNKNLCPVLALQRYINSSNKICEDLNKERISNLWIKHLMRNWLRKVINFADLSINSKKIKFHSVRGVVASNLFNKLSLNDLVF